MCWRKDGCGLQDQHVAQTAKFGGGSVMIWGCMTSSGPGLMCRVEGTMNSEQYGKVLASELQGTIEMYGLNRDQLIFQHDNAPCHKARVITQWLEQQCYTTLRWPAQSPDLNPIETLWAILKQRLNAYEAPPNGVLELWERVKRCWSEISPDVANQIKA